MRKAAVFAVIASVVLAGSGTAGTPDVTDELITSDRLSPITATWPPLSQQDMRMRCLGFFRVIDVRHGLARALGHQGLHPFDFVSDLPVQRLELAAGNPGRARDFVTSYMRAFGPINPFKTARSGLYNADKNTCTAFLDALD